MTSEKIYNMHYTSHVKLFRLIKEENDLMKSSFEGRREHFVNLQIKNGETIINMAYFVLKLAFVLLAP